MGKIMLGGKEVMSESLIHNGIEPPTPDTVAHIYVHIPFCARICPYCAFYNERADSAQTQRFCEALLRELDGARAVKSLAPETIFIGRVTPTALTTSQLEFLLGGFRERLALAA